MQALPSVANQAAVYINRASTLIPSEFSHGNLFLSSDFLLMLFKPRFVADETSQPGSYEQPTKRQKFFVRKSSVLFARFTRYD